MAGSLNRRSTIALARVPELARFGAGPYVLHWLGQLRRSENPLSPTGVDMSAHFLGEPKAEHAQVDLDLPLVYLLNLRLGMTWRNGASIAPTRALVSTARVDMAQFDRDRHAIVDPMNVIPPSVIKLASVALRSWCRLVLSLSRLWTSVRRKAPGIRYDVVSSRKMNRAGLAWHRSLQRYTWTVDTLGLFS